MVFFVYFETSKSDKQIIFILLQTREHKFSLITKTKMVELVIYSDIGRMFYNIFIHIVWVNFKYISQTKCIVETNDLSDGNLFSFHVKHLKYNEKLSIRASFYYQLFWQPKSSLNTYSDRAVKRFSSIFLIIFYHICSWLWKSSEYSITLPFEPLPLADSTNIFSNKPILPKTQQFSLSKVSLYQIHIRQQ